MRMSVRTVAGLAAAVLLLAIGAPASAARPRPDRTPPTAPTQPARHGDDHDQHLGFLECFQ